jgi:hypothetical protein
MQFKYTINNIGKERIKTLLIYENKNSNNTRQIDAKLNVK